LVKYQLYVAIKTGIELILIKTATKYRLNLKFSKETVLKLNPIT